MMMRTFATATLLLTCVFFPLGAAAAASSDCPKPTGIAEPLKCGDPALAGLEAQVTTALAGVTVKLSAPGRSALHNDQAEWHKYLGRLCLGEPRPGAGSAVDCLKQEYDRRRAGLARTLEVMGGLTLLRRERFAAQPARGVEEAAHPVRTEIAWPEIDHPATPAQKRWNEALAKQAEQLNTPLDRQDPDTDVAIDYHIESIDGDLIQTVFTRDLYIHGAAHGDDMTVSSLFLVQVARPLLPEDVFDPAKAWKEALADQVYQSLTTASRDGAWRLWPRRPAEMIELVAEPARWLLKRSGLVLHFDAYEIAGYAAGPHDVAIPWTALTSYLQANPALHLPPR
jgi:hypothetical protein